MNLNICHISQEQKEEEVEKEEVEMGEWKAQSVPRGD